ncbi:MAG: MotA/TolQ/ExbB proton channel family protein [Thermoguttaceae bacterium]|nr:MotA/TolQ/ExbB proton channel family protein [Thermoguttaceae bacterium]
MNRYLRLAFLFFFLAFPLALAAQDIDFDSSEDDTSFLGGPQASAEENPGAANAAADSGAAGEGQTQKKENYLVWMFRALGWVFGPVFVILSLVDVALIVMNMMAIRRVNLVPESLVLEFGELMDNQKFQDAYQVAKENDSLLGRVLAAGLSKVPSGYEKAVQTMQDVGQEETMKLEHQIGYLALVGNLAPMVGLFGTVVGMIASFQVIAAGGATPSPQKLAEGIATALFTTMIGLTIALPSLAIYDIIKNRLARFILEIGIISDNYIGRFSSVTHKK